MEKAVQAILPRYMSAKFSKDCEQFTQEVIDKVMSAEDVQFQWCLVSQVILMEDDQQALLRDIVKLWVTIRGFSIVACWMESYKQLCHKGVQKSTGQRKSLSGCK